MASSSFFSSSTFQKMMMALTGLFLCTFLLAHLFGNLPLILMSGEPARVAFNDYAAFMSGNPFIKIMSYVVYASILFHAFQGLYLAITNKQARPVKYAHPKMGAKNSSMASRNMGILGTIVLIFIVVHMSNFWYGYKFGDMPITIDLETNAPILKASGEPIIGGVVKEGHIFLGEKDLGKGAKDLYTEVMGAFTVPWYVLLYVLSMIAIGFHLYHGIQSAFQSLGLKNKKFGPLIEGIGKGYAILVPAGFAVIPVIVYLMSNL